MAARFLDNVLASDLCAGCGGCAAAAPGRVLMEMSDAGYLRPRATGALNAAQAAAIEAICPATGLDLDADGRTDHPLWGPIVACRRGHAGDTALRHAGSSGGGLSALAAFLLETGAVDGVLQVTAADAPAYANRIVLSRTRADVQAAAGSRYAPSAPLAAIEDILAGEERIAFVGKPCDVAALRGLAKLDARVDQRFPVMLSFFCAGVPAEAGGAEVVAALGVAEEDLATFRYRGNGWPGMATATTRDGRESQMTYNDSWGRILTKHVQKRCKLCPDGTGGFADVACADAWDCDENGYPVFDEQPGQSLIVSRTARGEKLVADALAAGAVVAEPLDPSAVDLMQPGQAGRKKTVLARTLALRLLGRMAPKYSGLHVWRNAGRAGLRQNARAFLGTLRRALQGRI